MSTVAVTDFLLARGKEFCDTRVRKGTLPKRYAEPARRRAVDGGYGGYGHPTAWSEEQAIP
jgi:hypothetical protein